jgi:hypothetical protein
MKSLVVDNFLPYPNIVRSWALSQEYFDSNQFSERYKITTSWPGIRTDHVMDMDLSYANVILSQVSMLAQNFSNKSAAIKSYFQICTEDDGDSWIHQDNDVDLAAILYLSPNAPPTSGTSLFRCNDYRAWQNLDIKTMMQINRVEAKDLYDNLFTPIDTFGNVYNRLVMYRGDEFHKSNDYFGKGKDDGRLTQVFFLTFEK